MIKLNFRLGMAALVAAVVIYGCGNREGSPAGPEQLNSRALRAQAGCGEYLYLSQLSPVLPVWEDSIETWLGAGLDDTPAWTDESTVAGYLGLLVPALQQWEAAINGALASAVLDTVADFDPATTPRQGYLTGLSSLLVSWKAALETQRGRAFLPDPPVFQSDVTAPEIICVADTTIDCADAGGAVLEFSVTAFDDCDPLPVVTCDPPSGSTFPVGATEVSCTAVDSLGNTSTCSFTVTVATDTEPPVIVGATASPRILWPPNHKWRDIRISVDAEDACDSAPTCKILEVTSNEPVNGTGDGNTEPDWLITGDTGLKLRAERSGGGSSRIYTVLIRCEDSAGNSAETTIQVVVPHDQGKGGSI
jgi:hypothetical protein